MPSEKRSDILFVVPYVFDLAPGQRFRYEQYLDILKENGFSYTLAPFLDEKTNDILYDEGKKGKKITGVLKGFLRRLRLLSGLGKYDYIFIFREASPIGPPFFEWFVTRILRKKVIYDFDDAIWLPNTSEQNSMAASLKWHHKVEKICRWSYKVSAGNEYLADFARQYAKKVVVNPTTIDTEGMHKPSPGNKNETFTIGWTGSHSTMFYIDPMVPVLDKLAEKFQFRLLVISNQPPDFTRPYLDFVPWDKASEITDLQKMHVGMMPLSDDKWARGKCGFKALQYMALKIPAIVSPVGVNTKIVDHGVNGFICGSDDEWEQAFRQFLENPDLIGEMAEACRKKIVENYSVKSNTQNFLELFS